MGKRAFIAAVVLGLAGVAISQTRPDQVLVIYNADWTGDLPGTQPGQDSREVAEYYVRMRSCPQTGRRPHLLGLTCGHTRGQADSCLNAPLLTEASGDNRFGVVYTGSGEDLTPAERRTQRHYLLSNRIEVRVPLETVAAESIRLTVRRPGEDESADQVAYSGPGGVARPAAMQVDTLGEGGGQVLRVLLDAPRAGWRGDLLVRCVAADAQGQTVLDASGRFFDPDDLAFSLTGPDGVRDDLRYIEDIEQPIRAFLQDPANAIDGVLLRDHVTTIVIAYGLPTTVSRYAGLAQTAVPASERDAGHLVSLSQRLEMLWYDRRSVRPPRVVPFRLDGQVGPFARWAALSNYWLPMHGRSHRPLLHPHAFTHGGASGPVPLPRPLEEAQAGAPRRRLLICSRIDGERPQDAMHMVDAALYAERHLTPHMGHRDGHTRRWDGTAALAAAGDRTGWDLLEALGLPGVGRRVRLSSHFGRLDEGGYLPGAADWYVISANSVASADSQVRRMLRDGVTVTAGVCRAYGGAAHTTSHAWWDDRVFWGILLGGGDLAHAWAASRYYAEWVTSFFGDPLYRPDLRATTVDTTAPRVASAEDIVITPHSAGAGVHATVAVAMRHTPADPELARIEVAYWPAGRPADARRASDPAYRARPSVVLSDLAGETDYRCRVTLTDPYGNTFDSEATWGELSFRTPAALPVQPGVTLQQPQRFALGGRGRIDRPGDREGQIELTWVAGDGGGTIVRGGVVHLRIAQGQVLYTVGGGTARAASPFQAGRVYHLRLNYRAEPLARELWLVAANGQEFLLAADNRTAWRDGAWAQTMVFSQTPQAGRTVKAVLVPQGRAASPDAPSFDREAFEQADAADLARQGG